MKKLFILMLSVVAMVAFTSSAFALHGVKDMFEYTPQIVKSKKAMINISGHIRVRGELADNYTDFHDNDGNGGGDDEVASYNSRVNVMLDATVSPNTKGVIEFQSEKFGSDGNSDSVTLGACTPAAKGTYTTAGNCKLGDVTIRQAYISHQGTGLLGNLSGFKAGHMLIALGNGQYYNHTEFGDDALIFWTQPMDNTEIALAIIKGDENGGVSGASADDVDIYALTFATVAGGANVSGDVSYLNDNGPGGAGVAGNYGQGLNLWNLGIRGDMDVSGVKLSVDANIQTGEMENFKTAGSKDLELSGWAIEVKGSTRVGDIGVHGGIGYGSGDDIDSTDDFEGFMNSLGNGQDYTYLYDQKARTSAQAPSAGASSSTFAGTAVRTGLANTLYVNAGADTNVNPDVKVSADLYWLQAAEKVSNTAQLDDKDIGVEVDTKVTYQIDTNLVWYVEAGYLFAGDFYRNITGATVEPDDAYSVRHGVVLTF